jgi:nucleoside-diphosphate-sugar epimerase
MGFNEVEACVKEWLEIDKGKNTIKINHNRFGIRQTSDKSIPIERNDKVLSIYKKINGMVIKKKKTLLITGSGGYLGQNVINELLKSNSDSFEIWAFDLDKSKLKQLFDGRVQSCFDIEDLEKGRVQLGNIDILLHFGFARSHYTNSEIANSLQFTNGLFTRAVTNHVPAIINISSQSVYGQKNESLCNENTPVAPDTLLGQEKYASELLLQSLKRINNQLFFSSLRLGTISSGSSGLVEGDLLPKIVRKAYEGKTIHLRNSIQELERLDIRDAVLAFLAMLESNPIIWKPIYNLGSCKIYKLIDIVEKIVEYAERYNGGKRSEIIVDEKEVTMKIGMDCSLFINDMGWKPKYDIGDTIDSIISYYRITRLKL